MLNTIEEKFIFPTLRISSIGVILILMIISVFILLPEKKPKQITFSDIQKVNEEKVITEENLYKMPKIFTDGTFQESTRLAVKEWAEELKPEYQQEFVNGLEKMAKKSMKITGELMGSDMLIYKKMQYARFNQIESAKNPNEFQSAIKYMTLICLMMCLVLFCNLLALLKINRTLNNVQRHKNKTNYE